MHTHTHTHVRALIVKPKLSSNVPKIGALKLHMHIKLREAPAQEAHAVQRPRRCGSTNTHDKRKHIKWNLYKGGRKAAVPCHRSAAEEQQGGEARGDGGRPAAQRIPPASIIY